MAEEKTNDQECVNFTGKWELRTSEKLDEYLKEEGWGFIMRKAAAAVSATQIILQDGDKTLKVNVKNKKGIFEYTAPLDGSEIKYVDNDKDDVISKSVFSDDKQAIIESVIKGKESKQYKTTRYMENGEMRLKIENAKGKYCIRIFKKISNK
mmetsp:Transcript_1757/g.3452  ORF Transcript_1757/g.3452 Transcript_1757/m.3452 type:complete len:152 (+) Transcript_1757:58-513(+)